MGAQALRRALLQRGRAASPALVGMYDFGGTAAGYAALVAAWLRDAPAGAVLMCHPGAQADADDPIGAARLREFDCWRGDAVSALLARANAAPARGPAPRPGAG